MKCEKMNILEKITMPIGLIYNIYATDGCKLKGKAYVEHFKTVREASYNNQKLNTCQLPAKASGLVIPTLSNL